MEAQPLELVVGNIVRRVLFIIREEHAGKLQEKQQQQQLSQSQSQSQPSSSVGGDGKDGGDAQLALPMPNLRTAVMEAIGDLQLEVRASRRR